MQAHLIIPHPSAKASCRWKLRWTDKHPLSSHGLGVLLTPSNEVFDGLLFRHLRDAVGAWIEADEPRRVAGALGVPTDEQGIKERAVDE